MATQKPSPKNPYRTSPSAHRSDLRLSDDQMSFKSVEEGLHDMVKTIDSLLTSPSYLIHGRLSIFEAFLLSTGTLFLIVLISIGLWRAAKLTSDWILDTDYRTRNFDQPETQTQMPMPDNVRQQRRMEWYWTMKTKNKAPTGTWYTKSKDHHIEVFSWSPDHHKFCDSAKWFPHDRANVAQHRGQGKGIPLLRDSDNRTCMICLEDFKSSDSVAILPCTHCFHSTCVQAWLNRASGLSCAKCTRSRRWNLELASQ